MLANGCFVSDASHRYDDPEKPITWQGFETKGPTRIGDNCWLGANVVVTSGVTIGERCVIGANSVVTHDIESHSVAAGAPGPRRRAAIRLATKDSSGLSAIVIEVTARTKVVNDPSTKCNSAAAPIPTIPAARIPLNRRMNDSMKWRS